MWLTFKDPNLEARYRRAEFQRNERWTAWMFVFGTLLSAVFATVDRYAVPEEALYFTVFVRLLVVSPTPLLGLFFSYRWRDQLAIRDLAVSSGLVVLGACWTILIIKGGPETVPYHSIAMIHTLMFSFFLIDLPFRYAVVANGLISIPFLIAVYLIGTPISQAILSNGVPAALLIGSIAMYRSEAVARGGFLAQQQSEIDSGERLRAEQDRVKWFAFFANFLRHELHNSISGIASSLELIKRAAVEPKLQEYVERALRSLQFMRNMLRQVAEATTLEAALARQSREKLDLCACVRECTADFAATVPDWRIEIDTDGTLWIEADLESLTQLMQKLLNNAVEHASEATPIRVTVRREHDTALVSVSNRGAALPSDTNALFQPFFSTKTSPNRLNLGLGLYVARVIARHHGGELNGASLPDGVGALFVMSLPILEG